MTDFSRTARPDVFPAGGEDLDGLLGPLAAYLRALEARVAALERRLSAVPLMTAADAARTPGSMWRRSCARSGPASSRWPAMSAAPPGSPAMPSTAGLPRDHPRRRRFLRSPASTAGERQAMPSRRHGKRWAECRAAARSRPRPTLDTYGHVMDELDHAPRLAAVDAIMQARSGAPPERPGLTVSSA